MQGLRTVPRSGRGSAGAGAACRLPGTSTRRGWPAPDRRAGGRTPRGGGEAGAMRLAVVGGKLQGTEAAYLAGKAGYDVVLIDRRPGRPPRASPPRCTSST